MAYVTDVFYASRKRLSKEKEKPRTVYYPIRSEYKTIDIRVWNAARNDCSLFM